MSSAGFVERIAERVLLLEGWSRALVALIAGALSALSLAPYHAFLILLITLPVLVWLLDGALPETGSSGIWGGIRRLLPGFRIGWLFGFGYFLAGFWWVGQAFLVDADEFAFLLPVAVVALPAGLALFWGIGGMLARLVWSDDWTRILGFAASFTLAEWLRGSMLTGLPWNVPGYAAMPTPVLMQSASLVGLYGVTLITLFVAASPALLGFRSGTGASRSTSTVLTVAAATCVAHLGFGLWSLSSAEKAYVDDIKLRVVQPALDQKEKWDITKEPLIMARYFELSNANKGPEVANIAAFTHVIWPESAFPFILSKRADQLSDIAKLLPPTTSLITGAMRMEEAANSDEQPKVFNSLYVINGNGETIAARDKVRLLPFGEFLPFQNFLENLGFQQLTRLRGGFAAGHQRSVVDIPGTPTFLPLICYEIIFSGRIHPHNDASSPQPKWIVNLTNDAWFGMTAGPYQHAHQAQVRAVEEGLPVVRAANNGISFVADAYGRIEESLSLGQRGVVDSRLPVAHASTLFRHMGNWPVMGLICLIMLGLLLLNIKSKHRV
ncbi:MAG: apolipoprotein N-acyltransferase [Rhizobiaceae bacterium]|nr:apolipoprotein N-acyltransferase [Hyphomicrobiales bacterium]NRB29299.1 apolipoprotein N-acyltransferase [Rhizobiaceae bacterium]